MRRGDCDRERADLSIFPTAAHLASWAGTCPGSNESAGRVKSTVTRPGNPYLKAALGAAALSIANTPGTYLAAKYGRIAARRGPKKAFVAVEHAILIAIWNMAHTGARVRQPRRRLLHPPRPRTRSLIRLEPAPAAWLPRHTQPRRRISL
jgi:transposase